MTHLGAPTGTHPGERAELAVQALNRHRDGESLRAIAVDLGVHHSTVAAWVQWALQETLRPAADEYRTLQNERLEAMWRAAWANAQYGDEKAMAQCVRILERQSKLLGLDKPVVVEATVTHQDETDAALRELIQQAHTRSQEVVAEVQGDGGS